MASKTDLRKVYKELYNVSAEPSFVEVPELACFLVDGEGDPNKAGPFQECVEALYAASYALKFASKKAGGPDWTVQCLEGDWWCDTMEDFSMTHKEAWKWSLLIVQPDWISEAQAQEALEKARAQKGANPALARLRFERRPSHRAAQVLYRGSYDLEGPTIALLHSFIKASGAKLSGRHREIYLSDARKTAPEKLQTIIRQPVV